MALSMLNVSTNPAYPTLSTSSEETTPTNSVTLPKETRAQNESTRSDCIKLSFSELEFLPWDNPDNLISGHVETVVRQIKNNLLVLLFLIGGPANVINMAVFYKQGLKDRVNLCLFCLSLVDGFYLITAMMLHTEQLYIQFTTKQRFGPMTIFITNNYLLFLNGSCFISPILSAIIATERCLCVFNPLKFQTLIRTRTMAAIILTSKVVVLALFFFVSLRFRFGCVYDPESGVSVVTGIDGDFYLAHKVFIDQLDSFVFGVGLHGSMIIVVTTTTVLTIVKLRQIVLWRSETSSIVSPREIALTKTLVGNSILFIACISPTALIRFSWLFFPEMSSGRRNQNFFLAGVWVIETFTYINATCNIFIYYVMGSRYRETFWSLFGRKVQAEKS